ncbi:MAG: XRE family transcriptional regulator [Pseudomonadota bacterium]
MTTTSLGADLRALRKSRRMTLQSLADDLGKSVGWLSQIERDLSTPDPTDLEAMADALDVSKDLLTTRPGEDGIVVRADARRPIGNRVAGLTEELLSPDLTDDFQAVHSVFDPGAARDDSVRRGTQELAYIVAGRLDVWLDGEKFSLSEGDSFRMRGQRFRWANPYETPAVAIWIIAPPVY